MEDQKVPRSLGTHDGAFHADEVTACALLLLFDLIDSDKIVRTRSLEQLASCEYVCDVGGIYDPAQKLFDHHQVQYQGMMSSAGMTLLYLKDQGILKPNEYQFFNHALILGVDASDNGNDPQIQGLCTYSHVVSNFSPIDHNASPQVQNEAFFEALEFALGHLRRLWERYCYTQSCRQVVEETMNKYSECLIFEKGIPWLETFFELDGVNHPAKFVIMPSGSHWKLRGIPPTYEDRMNVRFPLPQEWAGLIDEELKKISGIDGAIFCHKGRFISVWETREDALNALDYILNKEKKVL
ncbi:MYG1 family protein [Parachlamydia sp. AcF125]|uniref:MYG1 family protein n=1 Tax=Parachlamydia sp. AcF125 TaxID=2795736 RepID=UPI001BCA55E2|nr:MYG1 family protein [Parachlamydia sp. AcF125]MBS4168936.1 hypothetical protein [Parachlamydia sp. AcF125]